MSLLARRVSEVMLCLIESLEHAGEPTEADVEQRYTANHKVCQRQRKPLAYNASLPSLEGALRVASPHPRPGCRSQWLRCASLSGLPIARIA